MYIWGQLNDANNQLAFIEQNLIELEKEGKFAIILGHIPDECSHEYSERLRAVFERFQKTIRISMFGHTHTDLFKVTSAVENNLPTSVFTVCGSITTWGSLNPSYCEYEVDKQTLLPINRRTYFFDITKANQTG
jgi:hypothetical protein